jgi:hypothetical protein
MRRKAATHNCSQKTSSIKLVSFAKEAYVPIYVFYEIYLTMLPLLEYRESNCRMIEVKQSWIHRGSILVFA